ncbi:MAG: sensor histidine kinase [Actinomycetota bacterium]
MVLGLAHLSSRPLNGVALESLDPPAVQNLAGAVINYLVAGVAVGLVSRLLTRSEDAVRRATEELVRERERAARLSERETLARAIHDSVLQALSLVHKRGREMAQRREIPPEQVAELAEIAGRQEGELRRLVMREPAEPSTGTTSLRDALEAVAAGVDGLPVTVSTVGPVWLDARRAEEIAAAVRQALENVARHAAATKTSVFAERDADNVTVSVRDDGSGFVYDEERLRSERKGGISKSMKGRIEELGGAMTLHTAPGRGTEIEFKVPAGEEW